MNKTLSFALAACMAVSASAATFSGTKYYINPGHGGHDSNDRPTPMPLNVPMFYESDGNLERGLQLRDMLQGFGASVKMSRVTNTTADDLALTTICTQSNSYGGYFMSLHTNGANASANYIVSFFRTASSSPTTETISGSKNMATKVSNWHNINHLTSMTYSTPRAIGDYSFYGYNLGALRTNNRPGYLVETVFHDYRPDALRMKNNQFLKHQAWQILMATKEALSLTDVVKGEIIGDVRDLSQACGYTDYVSRGRDQYKAVNGATVTLTNSAGTTVATYTTDSYNNGIFGFSDLTAGTYTITVSKSGYKTQSKSVTVSNGSSACWQVSLEQGADTGIGCSSPGNDFGEVYVGESKTSNNYTVTGTSLTANIAISSSNAAFVPSVTSLGTSGGTFKITFKPTIAGSQNATITLKSGTFTKTFVVTGTGKNKPLDFAEGWQMSETKGNAPSWLPSTGWVALRNMCYGDGKLYVVSPSTTEVFVLKAQTGELITKLDMTGVSEGTFKIMDVKYVDGKVIGCNLAADANAAIPVKVYVWDTDYSAPRCILSTNNFYSADRQCNRIGDTFDVQGSLSSGKLLFSFGGSDACDSHIITYNLKNGTAETTPSFFKATLDDGSVIKLGTSPRVVAEGADQYWIMGQNYVPTLIQSDGKANYSLSLTGLDNVYQGNDFCHFTFKGAQYGLATTYASGSPTLSAGKMVLLDATDGLASASQVAKLPAAGLGTTRNTNFSTSVEASVNGDKGVEAWVLVSNQGLAYYKYGTTPTYTYVDPTAPLISTSLSSGDFGKVEVGESKALHFDITGANLTADIKLAIDGTNASMFDLSATSVAKTGGSVVLTYTPTDYTAHSATLTITSAGAPTLTYALTGQGIYKSTMDANTPLEDRFNVSETAGNLSAHSWYNATATGTTLSMGFVPGTQALYVCTNNPSVTRITPYAATPAASTELNVTGVSGGTKALSSIRGLGSSLYGSNLITSATATLKIYRWKNDTDAPEAISITGHGCDKLGEQINVWGDETDGRIMFSEGSKIVWFAVKNGVVNTTPNTVTLSEAVAGNRAEHGVVYDETDGSWWVMARNSEPTHFNAAGTKIGTFGGALHGKAGNDMRFFDYQGRRFAMISSYRGGGTLVTKGVFQLFDVTDGTDKPTLLGTYPDAANGLGTTTNGNMLTSLAQETSKDGLRTNLWVQVPRQGIAGFRFDAETTKAIDGVMLEGSDLSLVCNGAEVYALGIDAQRIDVYDLNGSLVRGAKGSRLNVAGLKGIYVVRATTANGPVTAKLAL